MAKCDMKRLGMTICDFLGGILIFVVNYEPMQNFKTLAQPLLGEELTQQRRRRRREKTRVDQPH
jgi:hypothetical protein